MKDLSEKKPSVELIGLSWSNQLSTEYEFDSRVALNEKEDDESRPEWGNRLEFLLTCVGYSVGLGTTEYSI